MTATKLTQTPVEVPEDQSWLTREEAAEFCGTHPRTVDRWANQGKLPRYRLPGSQQIRFKREDVVAVVTPVPDAE